MIFIPTPVERFSFSALDKHFIFLYDAKALNEGVITTEPFLSPTGNWESEE